MLRMVGVLVAIGMLGLPDRGYARARQLDAELLARHHRAGAPAEHAAEPEPAPVPDVAGTTIRHAILRVDGRPFEDVRDALAPRLSEVELLPFEDATFEAIGGELFAYVELTVDPGPDAETQLTIVLSDRRAYLRSFTPDPAHPLRSIATTVANTLIAIEQEEIEADEQAVDVPRPEPAPEPEPEPASEPEPEPAPETEPETTPSPSSPPPTPPPFALGIALGGLPLFGLTPGSIRGFAAAGGELRLSIRERRGPLVELGLRVITNGDAGHRLWRNRLQLAAGYGWRSGEFGVAAVLGPTVEPWAVRSSGSATTPLPVENARATPLWGAAAAVTPALFRALTPSLRLRLGLRLELATSVLSSGAAGRILSDEPEQPRPQTLFGFGGLEVATGVELTLWIAPRGRDR
ncbi:MAG: hypothetical protein AAGF11_24385 [Myxococcota bacterium]